MPAEKYEDIFRLGDLQVSGSRRIDAPRDDVNVFSHDELQIAMRMC